MRTFIEGGFSIFAYPINETNIMETLNKTNKFAKQNGLLFGILLVLEFVIMYFAGLDPIDNPSIGTVANLLNYLIFPITLIALAATQTRSFQGGVLSFGQAVKTGVIISLIGSAIYGVFYIIFNLIFPEFTPDLISKMEEQMLNQNPEMTQEQVDMTIGITKTFLSPWIAAPFGVLIYVIVGTIESLVIGAIVKRERH